MVSRSFIVAKFVEANGRRYILRVYRRGGKSREAIATDLEVQEYFREHGIPVPRIYRNLASEFVSTIELEGSYWNAILMQFCEGSSRTSYYTPEIISALAPLQARMHLLGMTYSAETGRKGALWSGLNVRLLGRELSELRQPDARTSEYLSRARRFDLELDPGLPYGYNHLDLDISGNVIVDGACINGIIDFDDLAYSPCVLCLAYTLWSVLAYNGKSDVQRYLDEYMRTRPLCSRELAVLLPAMMFRNYVVGVFEIWLGKTAGELEGVLRLEREIPGLSLAGGA